MNSLNDQRFILEHKGFVQHCRNGVVFSPGLQHQALVSWNLVLLQLLHSPLPCSHRHGKWTVTLIIMDDSLF